MVARSARRILISKSNTQTLSRTAHCSWGTVSAEDASVVLLRECVIRDSSVGGELPWGVTSAVRQGGAVSAVTGHLTLDSDVFHNSRVMPPGGMADCVKMYQSATASTTDYRGGAVAISEGSFQSMSNTVFVSRACSGGYMYFTGRGELATISDAFTDLHAYPAGGFVVVGAQSLLAYFHEVTRCGAERAAGLWAVSSCQKLYVTDSTFTNVTVSDGEYVESARAHTGTARARTATAARFEARAGLLILSLVGLRLDSTAVAVCCGRR